MGVSSHAATDMPAIFNHHMVLQREMPVPIFGTDTPGTAVTVQFAGQSKTGTTDKDGWRVVLDPLTASGEGRELAVSGSTQVTLRDILVGEVWMGCGQSNMVIAVGYGRDTAATTAIPHAPHSMLNHPFG